VVPLIMTLKVVFLLARSDEIGGAHIHVKDMAKYVLAIGGKAVVVAGGNGVFADLIRANGIKYISISSLGRKISIFSDFLALLRLNKVLRGLKCDLVSAHSAKAGLLVRLLAITPGFPPVIFTAHGWSFAFGVPMVQRLFSLNLERLLALFSRKIVTVCNSDKLLALSQGVARPSTIKVIHNGMPSLPLRDKQSRHHQRSSSVRIVTIARYEKQKDHDTLLRALARIPERHWQMTLLGGGPGLESVKSLALSLGIHKNLEVLGRCSDVVPYLDSADIFVLSSHWEGFPRSILEAMRSSLPVVATDVGGVSESVIDNYNGFCVAPCDADALAAALRKLLVSPELREIMGERSRDLFEAKFTFSRMAAATWDLYHNVLRA